MKKMDTLDNTVKTFATSCFVAVLTQTFQILTVKYYEISYTVIFPLILKPARSA